MRVTFVLCVSGALVPVTVTFEEPVGVPGEAVTVIVVVPEPTTVAGLKAAVAPVGKPLVENVTVPAKPLIAVTVIR